MPSVTSVQAEIVTGGPIELWKKYLGSTPDWWATKGAISACGILMNPSQIAQIVSSQKKQDDTGGELLFTVELSSSECLEKVTLEDLKIDALLMLANYILKSPTYKGDRNLVSMAKMLLQVQPVWLYTAKNMVIGREVWNCHKFQWGKSWHLHS